MQNLFFFPSKVDKMYILLYWVTYSKTYITFKLCDLYVVYDAWRGVPAFSQSLTLQQDVPARHPVLLQQVCAN